MWIFYKLPMITESVTVSDCMLTVRFCIHTAKLSKPVYIDGLVGTRRLTCLQEEYEVI